MKKYNFIIIGGGFYGCWLALFLKKRSNSVLLIEKEKEILTRASYNNQARVHNGYHYPRSFLTASRSHMNYLRFIKDYKTGIYGSFKQYYAIASIFSKTTAQQFLKFSKQLGSPIRLAPSNIKSLFDGNLIEDVFEVEEVVFDVGVLRKKFFQELTKNGIDFVPSTEVGKVEEKNGNVICQCKKGKTFTGRTVYNCTYAGINRVLENSNLPTLPFKNEFIEMPLIRVPAGLDNLAVTILDGQFFGFLPFPDRKCHSLWHVRYAIRANWIDPEPRKLDLGLAKIVKKTNWNFMVKDAKRYIPLIGESEYLESIYEIKTVLVAKEESDGRPILFRSNYGIKNFHIVMGGKIDNIYDIADEIKEERLV